MKRSMINKILLFVILLTTTTLFAQSDYEMVQSFKERYQKIAEGIKAAASLEDIDNLSAEIENLKTRIEQSLILLRRSL